MTAALRTQVFWGGMLQSWVSGFRRFERTIILHLQMPVWTTPTSKKVTLSFETSKNIHRLSERHMPICTTVTPYCLFPHVSAVNPVVSVWVLIVKLATTSVYSQLFVLCKPSVRQPLPLAHCVLPALTSIIMRYHKPGWGAETHPKHPNSWIVNNSTPIFLTSLDRQTDRQPCADDRQSPD
jgi:hypothetical protein